MTRLDRPVVVEGKYDKSKLRSFVDAVVVTTDGFAVLSDKKRLALIRRLAEPNGIILLTDPDAAGFRIRNFLKGALGPEKVTHIYVPDIYGKERRKERPSSEGKLGVEGMDREVLLDAFRRAGVLEAETPDGSETDGGGQRRFEKADLYALGLTGTPGSAARRRALLAALGLPERMGTNALCEALGAYDAGELCALAPGLEAPEQSASPEPADIGPGAG